MELYHFLKDLYEDCNNKCEFKDVVDFDEFINEFMINTFHVEAIHEMFYSDEEFLGTFNVEYSVNHDKQEIKLLFH